jgi:hypothetical protein
MALVKRCTKYARRKRDLKYMAWIRTLRCVCCGTRYRIQAAHVGDHPAYRKGPDRETIPLCLKHHLWEGGKESYHRLGKRFWVFWNIDRLNLVAELNSTYDAIHQAKQAA